MKETVTGGRRSLNNEEELHNWYSSQNIIRVVKTRRVKLAGHVARMREMRSVYTLLVRKPEGKRTWKT
jgi:hypothetical protein